MNERRSKFESGRLLIDIPALLDALGIVVAKREGRTLYALCPFHDDHNPTSWSIVDDASSSRSGLHYCFACQNGGGPVALVRQVLGLPTDEAVAYLKGGAVKREPVLSVDVVVDSYTAGARLGMRVPHQVKIRPPEEWPTPARRYLDERGITPAQIVRYDLGFALDGRLAGRIVFPMKDRKDRVISYTARDFTGQTGKRYLEPHKSEGAVHGALFGEHLWTGGNVLVVAEGCPDALALDRAGHRYDVCALHGSRLHPSQAVKFSRYPIVVVATDPDVAGDRVAAEIEDALGRYSIVVRARPDVGEDCASMEPDALSWMITAAVENAPKRAAP